MAFTVHWKDGAIQYETHRDYQLDAMRKRYEKLKRATMPAEMPAEAAEPETVTIKEAKKKVKKVG